MSKAYFTFKQFMIKQEKTAMKVGTDAVLLGSWTNPENCSNILDIGSGTGILCLMMAQKSQAHITGVELDEDAFQESIENIKLSKWANRIQIENQSIQEYIKSIEEKFDLIISNPPYFNNSLQSPNLNRNTARHNTTLNLEDLLQAVKAGLRENGKFTCILPSEQAQELVLKAENYHLYLSKICKVFSNVRQNVEKRWLMEFDFENNSTIVEQLDIEEENRHQYTEEYKKLTQDFYLNF